VLSRVRKWANYSFPVSLLRKPEIESGIANCLSVLDDAIKVFEINSNAILHQNDREMTKLATANQNDLLEMLDKIRASQDEITKVLQRQQAGERIVEPLMEAGQRELRAMRTRFAEQPATPNSATRAKYSQYEETVLRLHQATGIPPTIKRLDGEIERQGDIPFAGGLYCDVWLGTWLSGEKVALKALRGIKSSEKMRQRFEREMEFWAQLNHPNILPFYGIVTDIGQHIHMVSPWQDNGNLLEYVKGTVGVDHIALFRGSAAGLSYLHSRSVVHGNVRCANVLISAEGEPKLCDFGMSKVMEEVTEMSMSKTLTSGGSARYVAPELIESNDASATMHSDTYSFGMLVLECVTRLPPYANLRRDAAVIHAIIYKRECPLRPETPEAKRWITDDVWELMMKCWSLLPASRPSMTEVHTFFLRNRS